MNADSADSAAACFTRARLEWSIAVERMDRVLAAIEQSRGEEADFAASVRIIEAALKALQAAQLNPSRRSRGAPP